MLVYMCLVLVLTKNVLAEKTLQDQLQHLDHEVFCSQKVYLNLDKKATFLNHFNCVIISETFSQSECKEILVTFKKQKNAPVVFRKGEKSNTAGENRNEYGVADYLPVNTTLEELREKITPRIIEHEKTNPQIDNYIPVDQRDFFQIVRLTQNEQKILDLLFEAEKENKLLSREELSNIIWDGKASGSTYSQLSTLVQKIKTKCVNAGIQGETIITNWGKGYSLDKDFYEYLKRSKNM